MKLRFCRSSLFLILLGCSASWLMGQDATGNKSKASTRTVTGCLTKSGDSNKFVLTTSDGSTWDLNSDTVSLADHVGHTIAATGAVSNATAHNLKEDTKDAASDAHIKKNNTEHGRLNVTDIKTVSDSCRQ
jgi:Protein of unknown function (DUF5818)